MPTRALIQSFVESAPTIAWSNRPDGSTEFVNRQFIEYTGLSEEQLLADPWNLVVHPEDRHAILDLRNEKVAAFQPYCFEYRLRRVDGVYRWHSVQVTPLRDDAEQIIAWFGSAVDVDDRRRQEEALRQAEERFRVIFESSAVGVVRTKFDGARWVEFNNAFCRMLGYPCDELIGRSWQEFMLPEDIDLTLFERMARGELETYTTEKRFRHKTGQIVWIRLTVSLVRDAQGRPESAVGLAIDLTDSKQAEEALRESEARYRSLVEATSQIIWTCAPSGELVEPQPDWQNFTGQTTEQMLGWGWLDAVHPEDWETAGAKWRECVPKHCVFDAEFRVRRHDGVWHWMHARAIPVLDSSGNVREWVGASTDVTERKRNEEALRQSNEDLQRFGYVVGHDLQEPLRQVTAFSQMLVRQYGHLDAEANQYAKLVVEGAQRMQTLIRDLLLLARLDADVPAECFEATEVLRDAIAAVEGRLQESGGVVVIDKPLPKVMAPRPVVRQTFQNLLSMPLNTGMRNGLLASVSAETGIAANGSSLSPITDKGFHLSTKVGYSNGSRACPASRPRAAELDWPVWNGCSNGSAAAFGSSPEWAWDQPFISRFQLRQKRRIAERVS